jgi:nucleoside 2-deoxyribosyltransferase
MKAYIAAPFFSSTQLAIVESIKATLVINGIEFFSPKDESTFKQGDDPKYIIGLNCHGILTSDVVIAVTDDKDVGTMFECGFAYSHQIPIVYLWLGQREGQKFNLMLAASGHVINRILDIPEAIRSFNINYDGLIE